MAVGFIFVSMGSSVRASGMPEALRQIFVAAFATLPYNVVWKWEGMKIKDLPSNVRTAAWWPQQELLGHPKLQAFVSHGGLLSLHEAAYHAAPTLVLPVFCDHDGNAAQAGKISTLRLLSYCFVNSLHLEYRSVYACVSLNEQRIYSGIFDLCLIYLNFLTFSTIFLTLYNYRKRVSNSITENCFPLSRGTLAKTMNIDK